MPGIALPTGVFDGQNTKLPHRHRDFQPPQLIQDSKWDMEAARPLFSTSAGPTYPVIVVLLRSVLRDVHRAGNPHSIQIRSERRLLVLVFRLIVRPGIYARRKLL